MVTVAGRQLGHDVVNELLSRGHDAIVSGSTATYHGPVDGTVVMTAPYVRMDITDAHGVSDVLSLTLPDAVIHCSAWTAVDAAEDAENREKVRHLNVEGPRNLARSCAALGCKLVYISTDYVFSGERCDPWHGIDRLPSDK